MTRALRRLVAARPGLLAAGEPVLAAGRARTISGTESAERFPSTTIWAVTNRRVFVFDDARRERRRGLAAPVDVFDIATEVDSWGVKPFDDRDAVLVVSVAEGSAMVVMDPTDAHGIVNALGSLGIADPNGVTGAPAPDEEGSLRDGESSARSPTRTPMVPTVTDEHITGIREALTSGDWQRAKEAFGSLPTTSEREWTLRNLGGEDLIGGIEAWVAAAPDDSDGYLVRGANAVANAYRTTERADDPAFFDQLRFAERNLWWSVELAFADPLAFTPLIRSGGGLLIPHQELVLRFRESARRGEGLLGANLEMVVALGTTGSGSVGRMYEHIVSLGGSIVEGSPLHAVVPLAHLIAFDQDQNRGRRDRSFSSDVQRDVEIAVAMSVGSDQWTPGPGSVETVNILAAAIARGGDIERASAMLNAARSMRSHLPWAVLSDGAELHGSIAAGSAVS